MSTQASIIRTQFLVGQGLGNQLWVYAAGRGLAEHLGRPHVVSGMKFFKGAGFLEIDSAVDPTPDAPVVQFNEALFYDPELKYFSATYDRRVQELPDRVQINGLFQSEQYFYGRLGELAKWIRPSAQVQDFAAGHDKTCVINLRGGEYKRHKTLILPRSYWDSAVAHIRKRAEIQRIIVVTDDHAYARAFLPEFPVLDGGVAECYAALLGAHSIAISNSSFSYFPIKTRIDRPFVVAPEYWARYGHQSKRWAMPANIYEGWSYLGADGALRDFETCRVEANRDAAYYETTYSIRVPPNMGIGLSRSRHLPGWLKRPLKRLAALFFPKRIG